MKIETTDKYKVITPSEGLWLTNGETFSDCVYMPLSADENAWTEVTEAEKEEAEKKAEEEAEKEMEPDEPVEPEPEPEDTTKDGTLVEDEVSIVDGESTESGKWLGSMAAVTGYEEGMTLLYRPNVDGASVTTLNLNGLGEVTCNGCENIKAGEVVRLNFAEGMFYA